MFEIALALNIQLRQESGIVALNPFAALMKGKFNSPKVRYL